MAAFLLAEIKKIRNPDPYVEYAEKAAAAIRSTVAEL